jgi:hypothetical protein
LELFYDLTFVVAFGTAADQLAHYLADGHLGPAIGGFCFAVFAVTWAWMNYSWFASAYDNDDWVFRVATMVQMVGVIILSLGIPEMLASIDRGVALDIGIMVAGYVVMRVPMVSFGGSSLGTIRPVPGGAQVYLDDRCRPVRLGRPDPAGTALFDIPPAGQCAVRCGVGGSRAGGATEPDAVARTTSRSGTACW